MPRSKYVRPKLKVANCIECKSEFQVSRTKVSPRCPDCRLEYNRTMTRHTKRVEAAYRAADMQFSGPEGKIKRPGSEVVEDTIYQAPTLSYDEEMMILEREWELQELNECMTDADRFSYGSGWVKVEIDNWSDVPTGEKLKSFKLTEDNDGSVLYDSASGLRVSPPTVKSPRLPIGTALGATTSNRELQGILNAKAREALNHPWFTEQPWWQFESLSEIEQAQEQELADIRSRTRAACAREALQDARTGHWSMEPAWT